MEPIKIEIPNKGTMYLVSGDVGYEFIGDKEAIDYLRTLFKEAEKSKLIYHWSDHGTLMPELVKEADIFNCDAIAGVLEHNKIPVPEGFPTQAVVNMEAAKALGWLLIC